MDRPRLLVVEDDAFMADLICLIAGEAGFTARATYGEGLIVAYEDFKPDVIVLDILMPAMDGFEVLQFLNGRQSKARIVLLSVEERYRNTAELMAQGLDLTIFANIAKPFQPAELQELMESLLRTLPAEKLATQKIGARP